MMLEPTAKLGVADWALISGAIWIAANRIALPELEERTRSAAREALGSVNRQHPLVAACATAFERFDAATERQARESARFDIAYAVQDFAAWRQAVAYDAMTAEGSDA